MIDVYIANYGQSIQVSVPLSTDAQDQVVTIAINDYDHRADFLNGKYQYELDIIIDNIETYTDGSNTRQIYDVLSYKIGEDKLDKIYGVALIGNNNRLIKKTVVFDFTQLYGIRYSLAISDCIPCLDAHSKDKLLKLMFRETMLRDAVMLNKIQDAFRYYRDLMFLVKCEKFECSNGRCKNGMCTI